MKLYKLTIQTWTEVPNPNFRGMYERLTYYDVDRETAIDLLNTARAFVEWNAKFEVKPHDLNYMLDGKPSHDTIDRWWNEVERLEKENLKRFLGTMSWKSAEIVNDKDETDAEQIANAILRGIDGAINGSDSDDVE
jgi:nitric oxide synthase oxygenase domain/subunit